jgi:hypothetical protein
MPLPALLMVALRRSQHGEERQRPHPLRPRHARQQLQRDPAQATGLHEVFLTGAHRITVDAFGSDLRPATPLDRIVQPHQHRPRGGDKRAEQQRQPNRAQGSAGPARPVEHPMIVLKRPVRLQAERPQSCGDGPRAGRQDRPDEQRRGPGPYPTTEDWLKGAQHTYDLLGQVTHGSPCLAVGCESRVPCPFSFVEPMDKA